MRVLYIEDSAADYDLARRALAKFRPEASLELATTLAEGLVQLEGEACFDLVILDLSLPDGSGLSALSRARELNPSPAIMVLTGSGDRNSAMAALKAGADYYQVKRGDYLAGLPRALEIAIARRRESVQRQSRGMRVLYVEDNAVDVALMRRHLAHHAPHIRLSVVADGDAALACLPDRAGEPCPFDLLLLDLCLPDMDGVSLARVLREDRGFEQPIVLLTSHCGEEVVAHALHTGIDDCLTKHEGYLYEVVASLEKVQRQAELRREREALRATSDRLTRLMAASATILYSLSLTDEHPRATWVSDNITRILGYTPEAVLAPDWWRKHLHPDDHALATAQAGRLSTEGRLVREYRFFDAAGRVRWIRDDQSLIRAAAGRPAEVVGVWLDISIDKREEALQAARNAVLDQVVARQPLHQILEDLARRLEYLSPDTLVSILLLDPRDGRLHTAAAPSLPDFYNRAVDGLEPGEGRGSCGTSTWTGELVVIADIERHPYWRDYLDVVRRAGLAACWSLPFKDATGRLLGSFSLYHRVPREPDASHLSLMEEFARLTALAVTKVRDHEALRQAAAVFASTRDGVVIADLAPRIVAVNQAYTDITGYAEAEILGNNPSMLQSGRHDLVFYQDLWQSLLETGRWQGEIWNRRKNGEIYPQWLSITTVSDEWGEPHNFVGVFTDVTQFKGSEARLDHLAHFDPLTDLPNRLLMQSHLRKAIEQAERHRHGLAALHLDLDHFRKVNDSLGHTAGDELLVQVARRLQGECLREDIFLARIGGDEFLLLMNAASPKNAAEVAQSLIDLLSRPFSLDGGKVFVGLSIGISLYPNDAHNVLELLQHADAAMHLAKEQGRNTYRFHSADLAQVVGERLAMETRLREALERNEFLLYYQPLIDAASGRARGVEALLRWQPEGEEVIPPVRFIPLAEETGFIVPLGAWVLTQACTQAQAWRRTGLDLESIAVNLSPRQLLAGNLVEQVRASLDASGLPTRCLELELTEGMLMDQAEQSVTTLAALKGLGVRLAIDDFGTGYSSLANLKRFPIDKLKIDRSFVRGLSDSADDREIAATIIAMGRNLRLVVLAEGVETAEQRDILAGLGCDGSQGYLYSRPLPAEALATWLRAHGQ